MVIKKVSVIGAGTMGSAIAQVAAEAGCDVVMVDRTEERLECAWASIKDSLGRFVRKGKMTQEEAENIVSRIKGTVKLEEATKDPEVVIEAIYEKKNDKQELFRRLDELCPPNTVLASNSSTISITELSAFVKRKERCVGMHFFNPPQILRFVEIIRGLDTSEETLQVAEQLAIQMKMESLILRDATGFISNRPLPLFLNEAAWMLWEGIATVEQIDKVMKLGLNHPMGPFTLCDYVGIDIVLNVLESLYETYGERFKPCPIFKQMVAAGRLGRKTGRGFYNYT